jgi:protein-tyrosine phosphatase
MRRHGIILVSALGATAAAGCDAGAGDAQLAQLGGSGQLTGATLERQGDDFLLTWTADGDVGKVRIYTGTDPDDLDDLVATVEGQRSALITGLAPELRHYFRIRGASDSEIVIGERGLPQAGVVNLRDIGGYASSLGDGDDPAFVAWGTFFRSGFIPPSANQTFLATLGVKTLIDVRNSAEIEQTGEMSVPGATIIHRPIADLDAIGVDPISPHFCLPGNQTPECYAAQEEFFGPNGENLRALKAAAFRSFVTGVGPHPFNFGETPRDAIRTMLEVLADEDRLPLVWADTAGEARAGLGAAMAELLVGVSEEQVVADYALSTEFRRAVIDAQVEQLVSSGLVLKAEYIIPQLSAFPEYMEALLDQLHITYGSAIDYAHSLGITDAQIEQIRENLLRD